jgi:hypothetical protein
MVDPEDVQATSSGVSLKVEKSQDVFFRPSCEARFQANASPAVALAKQLHRKAVGARRTYPIDRSPVGFVVECDETIALGKSTNAVLEFSLLSLHRVEWMLRFRRGLNMHATFLCGGR